jgi:subtilisin family serine protease
MQLKQSSGELFSEISSAPSSSGHAPRAIARVSVALGLVLAAGCGDESQDEESAPPRAAQGAASSAASSTSSSTTSSSNSSAASSQPFVPLQAIVKFKPNKSARPITTAELAGVEVDKLDSMPLEMTLVHFTATTASARQDPAAATWAQIRALQARADVEYAHPNWLFQLSAVPNDVQYPNQWHYPLVQLPAAWDLTIGTPTTRIAILDTGRTAHPDLSAKWVPGLEYDAASEDGNAEASPSNTWRHAVHVAGIAGGTTNNGTGTAGVCWSCQLLNVNVAYSNSPDLASVVRGITWAVNNGAQILNMSFESNGLPCSDPSMTAMRNAIAFAVSNNVVPVAAAGNQGVNAANTVPASCPSTIAVAATDRNNALASYSNRGAVTLAAPGGGDNYGAGIGCPADPASIFTTSTLAVVSTWTTSPASGSVHCYRHLGGTSMSAPHVAGVVGLMLSRNPSLTPTQVRSILQTTAQPLPGCAGNCGAGLLNALGAVQQAAPLPAGDALPVPRITVSCSGLSCTFNGTTSTDDLGIVAYQWTLPGQQRRNGAVTTFFMPGYVGQTVRLRVTDTTGHSVETSQVVTPSQPSVTPMAGSWYNPQRSGNGLDLFETSGGQWLIAWYTYEVGGDPVWYSSGTASKVGARWSAPLYRVTWNSVTSTTTTTTVGSVSLDFASASSAWFSWVLNGVAGGEPFSYLFGGQGRSGSWYVPTQSGWGIQAQESGGTLAAAVSFYVQGQPRWMQGTAAAASNVTIPLSYRTGRGLCPSCGGSTPPVVDTSWSFSSMNLQIADGNATTGQASTDIQDFGPPFTPIWVRPLQTISLLTKP